MSDIGEKPGDDYIEVVTTYLELTARPERRLPAHPPGGLTVVRVENPPIHYYRYLYEAVGAPWDWWERRRQDDQTVRSIINTPGVEVFVPQLDGAPAGLVELDGRNRPEVELKYFGLMPEFIGKGIGGWLLEWTIHHVFDAGATRYWLHTCNFDSPQAIPVYKRAGFAVYDQTREWVHDPIKAKAQAASS